MKKIIIEYDKIKANEMCTLYINNGYTIGKITKIEAKNIYDSQHEMIHEAIDITFNFGHQQITIKGIENA